MEKYLPTPKVTVAIFVGLLAAGAIALADAYDLAEVQAGAASLLVLALSVIGAWLKRDKSSPDKGKGFENQSHPRTDP